MASTGRRMKGQICCRAALGRSWSRSIGGSTQLAAQCGTLYSVRLFPVPNGFEGAKGEICTILSVDTLFLTVHGHIFKLQKWFRPGTRGSLNDRGSCALAASWTHRDLLNRLQRCFGIQGQPLTVIHGVAPTLHRRRRRRVHRCSWMCRGTKL